MKNYYSNHRVEYKKETDRTGYTSIKILEFLKGHKWDDIALAYVHSSRPSCIRVTTNIVTCDAVLWRVTIIVDNDNFILDISQEVEVWLPENIPHGFGLKTALKFGIDSKQMDWQREEGIIGLVDGKFFKLTEDGTELEYPTERN